jgi:membrane-bound ClpP family serine protease
MGAGTVFRRRFGILGLIYIVIGIIVAIDRGYITVALLKAVLSAILAILLWWLVLLGVSLHIG